MKKRSSNQTPQKQDWISGVYTSVQKRWNTVRSLWTPAIEEEPERLFFSLFTAEGNR